MEKFLKSFWTLFWIRQNKWLIQKFRKKLILHWNYIFNVIFIKCEVPPWLARFWWFQNLHDTAQSNPPFIFLQRPFKKHGWTFSGYTFYINITIIYWPQEWCLCTNQIHKYKQHSLQFLNHESQNWKCWLVNLLQPKQATLGSPRVWRYGLKKWLDLDPGNVLLFSNLFSRCLFSMISVMGTQNNWIAGISELTNRHSYHGKLQRNVILHTVLNHGSDVKGWWIFCGFYTVHCTHHWNISLSLLEVDPVSKH